MPSPHPLGHHVAPPSLATTSFALEAKLRTLYFLLLPLYKHKQSNTPTHLCDKTPKVHLKNLARAMALLAVLLTLLVLPLGEAEERPIEAHPHGLPFESPLALSPAAYEFFHPGVHRHRHGIAPAHAPRAQLTESAVRGASAGVARADQEEGGTVPARPVRGGTRAGTVAGVFVGAGVVVAAALGVAYVVARRKVGVSSAHGDAEAGAPKSNS